MTKTTEETEAARVACGPDWGSDSLSEDELLSQARLLVRQGAVLEQLKADRRVLDARFTAADKQYDGAYKLLTNSVIRAGDSRAFQIGDKAVVVKKPNSPNAVVLTIMPLVSPPRVELGT